MTCLRLTFLEKHYTLRYILNYLRHGELLCPDDKMFKNELLNEASFYQVQGIISLLTEGSITLSKIIMEKSQASTVMSWLPSGASCTLIFRASSDGKSAADFHRCCDNKGRTLIVIQSGEFIFGGYTSKPWTSRKCLIKYILVLRWKVYFHRVKPHYIIHGVHFHLLHLYRYHHRHHHHHHCYPIITELPPITIIIIIIIINGEGQLSNTPTVTSYLLVLSLVR